MTAVNTAGPGGARLPLPAFSPRAVLMYSAALGGEGAVALQLREAAPGEAAAAAAAAIACHDPELLADLLHAADIGGAEPAELRALLGRASPAPPARATAATPPPADPDPDPDPDASDVSSSGSSSGVGGGGVATVSVSVAGLDSLSRPHFTVKKVRPKPASPNRQGPQQCQVCSKMFGNASALAKHKLTHSDERKYVCGVCAKAFKRQDHLNGHMLTHRNKKPYECKASGCGKSYCDARSLRRHTENHHHPPDTSTGGGSGGGSCERACIQYARGASPGSPAHPAPALSALTDSNSSSSEKSSAAESGGGSPAPAGSPPAPRAPRPSPPALRPATTTSATAAAIAKHTWTIALQQGHQKCTPGGGVSVGGATGGGGTVAGGGGAGAGGGAPPAAGKPHEAKPVECNLCHRKFKNIPALNGHMRLHGGYFKKDSESKKLEKKEASGPPLQTASVSVRALIEEKIISRRGASAIANLESSGARAGFATPAPPPLTPTTAPRAAAAPPAPPSPAPAPHTPPAPATAPLREQFVSPRAPTALSPASHRDSTLIELLKKGSKVAVKRSASDPGAQSPDLAFRPDLFGVSFAADDGYFSPALNDDTFQLSSASEHLDDLASLEDYATVAASLRDHSPVGFPSNRRLAAVLNSPLPEGLADFGAYHSAESPALPSPGFAYPTLPASHDARSPNRPPRASSPLSAAFFTATMSSAEEVEEALEEVLPEECDDALDVYAALDEFPATVPPPASSARLHDRMMLNSEDPLLSSSPRDFGGRRKFAFGQTCRDPRLAGALVDSTGELESAPAAWPGRTLRVEAPGGDAFLGPGGVPPSPVRGGRKRARADTASRGPYRSRLRLDHPDRYTPLPMLDPDRFGCGLYSELCPGSFLPPMETESDGKSEPRRVPRINVSVEHQASIPVLESDRGRLDREPSCEQLLWDPGINPALDDNEVRMFMELAVCAAMPVGGHSREHALQTLGECGGDVRAATLRLMCASAAPSAPATADHRRRWTPDEVEGFLAGLRDYDKDFYKISRLIISKDSKQCVQFYYFWKKVTKDYKSLFLQSWSADTGSLNQNAGERAAHSSCATSPAPCDGEEFPCKICGKVFNKVKSRSAHMKSHRPLDAETKRPKLEKPYEKVESR